MMAEHYQILALNYHNLRHIHVDKEWIAVEYLCRTKHKLWDDNLSHLQLINCELAKEAEDQREDVRDPLSIKDLEGTADADSDDDDDDDDDDNSSIE
jgi:hypothetical protein